MKALESTAERRVTTWSTIALSLGFLVTGLLLLWLSSSPTLWQGRLAGEAFVGQLGGLLVATGLVTLAWDLVGRRAFADEIFAKARISQDLRSAGLARVTNQYLEEVAWDDLFRDAKRVDIVVAYARTWRNTHRGRLAALARRSDARVRVFLPDPDDDATMDVLADRFDTPSQRVRDLVEEAIEDFASLATPGGAAFQVYVRRGDLVFSCYRFDTRAVLTMYSHSRKRQTRVPTFVVGEGNLFEFVYDEVVAILEQSTLRQHGPE